MGNRLERLEIDPATGKLEIDIMEKNTSFAIVVCNGQAKLTPLPDHGETKIITHQGKVKRVKYDEGEEF
ncbi:XtrA/YqaO family protein [Thalassobacillus sp. C254]|uniref:XtrA/YqaO family protein n=1 Tax=Thalassobacillus sp. C254 TaxID=1225341 RepID=UPI0006D25BFC|nr:XtrA/YqaO family protein [Thalassobacillus sp. C254]